MRIIRPKPKRHTPIPAASFDSKDKLAIEALREAVEIGQGVRGIPDERYVTWRDLQSRIYTLTPEEIHAEPAFAKNTAFNKDFGTTAGTVKEGFADNTAFNKNFGSTAGTVCQGNDPRLTNYNYIYNSNFDIWQRNTSWSGVSASQFTADRWRLQLAAGTATVTRFATSYAGRGPYVARVQNPGGTANTYLSLRQYLEANEVKHLQGKTVTVSCDIRCDGLDYMNFGLFYPNTTADDWAANTAIGYSGALSPGNGNYQTISWTTALPNDVSRGLMLALFFATTHSTAVDSYVSQVKLEQGSIPTPYTPPSLAAELASCQRYYEKSYRLTDFPGANTWWCCYAYRLPAAVATNNNVHLYVPFKVRKRALPTMTLYTPAGTSGNVLVAGTNRAASVQSTADSAIAYFRNDSGVTWADQDPVFGHFVAEAELI